jgi:MFS family permease
MTAPDSARAEWRASWTVVMAATAGISLSAISSASLGVMMGPIEAEFGWSRTEISLGTSLVSLIAMTLATTMGLAIDRIGPRIVGIAAAALMCAAVALMSLVGANVWQWWGLWCIAGLAAAAMPTVWLAPISGLFNSGRGLAMAVTLSGSGIATSLVPLIAHYLVTNHGWRSAYVGLGTLFGIVALPLILLFFRGPHEARSKLAAQIGGDAPPAAALTGLTARQGFRTPAFYKLAFAALFSMSAGTALITAGAAAGVASFLGISTISGRLLGGWLLDRINARIIAAVSTASAIGLPIALLLMPGSVPTAIAVVILYGLMGGVKVPAVAYLASKHFGQKAFGVLYGAINTMIALGVGASPLLANVVYDATKSYELVMWAAVPILATAALLYALIGGYPDFEKQPGS